MSGVVEVAAPYAILAAKYLFKVAKKWWDGRKEKKEIKENEPKVDKLMKEVEALKCQLEEKGKENITEEDVDHVNQQWNEMKNLGGAIKDDAASPKAFYDWVASQINGTKDIEELGEFYGVRLAQFINKSREEGMGKWKLDKYKNLLSLIEVNMERVREGKERVKNLGGLIAQAQLNEAELCLRNCLKDVDEVLRNA